MSDNRGLRSRQYGVGDDRLNGDGARDPLNGGSGHGLLQRRSACPKGMSARLSRLLHDSVPSASRGWRRAVCALGAALLLLLGAGSVAAQDAQDTLPTVSVSDVQAYEDDRWITFAVSLSQPSSEEVTVEFATSSGTATMGTDFRGGLLTLTFPPNRKDPRRVGVTLYDDDERESDETFTVTLTNPVGATLGDATATGTIRNDDTGATLTASDIEDTTATLTIAGHADGWWYKGNALSAIGPCSAVAAGTTAVSIGGLTARTIYHYAAYSDSTCTTRLAKVEFSTLAPEGTPTVSVSDAEVSEGGTWMAFRVSLSHPNREPVTVGVSTSGGTATSGTDFDAVSRTLTFPANSWGLKMMLVRVHDDQEPEPDETFTLTLTNPTGATLGDATATGTIVDDGDTAATLTPSDIEDTTATLTIGGHTDAWWYKGDAHGCTAVAAGTTSVSIGGLTAVSDYEYTAYSDDACSTKLANVEFDTIAPEGAPTVSVSDAEVSEDGGRIRFEVSLSQPSREPVKVWLVAWDGTAKGGSGPEAGNDFDSHWPHLVRFSANSSDTTRRVSVTVYDDQEPEPDETFTVTLTDPVGATLGDATATGTIRDDGDTSARLTASAIEDTTATLTIAGHTDAWWYAGNAHSCTAVAAGTTAVSIGGLTTITRYDYTAYSDSACSTKLAKMEFRTIAPEGTPTVSVSDAQVSEDGSWMEFRVSLSQPSREPVTVWFETSGGTATSGTDFDARLGHLSFSANSSEITRHANVLVQDDQEPEPDETFTVTLTNPTGATLGDATATGTIRDDDDTGATLTAGDIEDTTATLTVSDHTDAWWYKGNAHSCTAVAAGTTAVSISGLTAVTDYDYTAYSDSACSTKLANVEFRTIAPEGTPTVSVSDAEVSEDGTRMQFWVSLSQPSRTQVTVDVRTSDGTATSGTDYRTELATLTFPANSREPELVPVLVHDDRTPEPDETFTLTLSNPVGATLGDATATGTIRDDDTAATLAASDIEDTTATLTIGGHTDGWWFKGNTHPCTAVAAGTTAVGIGGLTTLTDYEYWAYSDSACGTRLARVEFQTIAPEGTPTVSVSDVQAYEDDRWMTFTVSLSQPSREQVTVEFATSSGTATMGTDFRGYSSTLTLPPNRKDPKWWVSVLLYDDAAGEPDETFTVTLTNPTGATLGDATATGTIRNDDTGATLTASDIEDTTATLTVSGHTDGWWYRDRDTGTSRWGTCTAVTAGTTAVSIGGLTALTTYEYWAYSDSACSTRLTASVEFRTIAPEGTPTVSVSDAEAYEDGTTISFKVSLSHPSREPVRVRFVTSDGTATGGTDYMAKGGLRTGLVYFDANSPDTTAYAWVGVYDDQEPEPDETFTVTLTSATGATLGNATATGTIRDDGDTAARLAASAIEDTTATLTISNHTDGWWYSGRSPETASPWGACTAVAAGTTAVSISGLTDVTAYEYKAYSDSACSTKLARLEFRTIAPEGTPTVSVSDAQVSEDGRDIRFRVSLSQSSRKPVRVWFETSSGTATSGTDFDARPGQVSFSANSSTTMHAHVTVYDDQEPEPHETFTLTLTEASNATLGDATATGTIRDDDAAARLAAVAIEDTTATLIIGGHTDAWWYKGNAHACTAVAAGTTAVGISGLTAVTDYEYWAYSDSACSTRLASEAFRTLAAEGVTPTVSVSDAEVSEDGTWMQFWVSLSQPSREEVTVDVQTSGGTATSGTDFKAVSQTLTFSANSREPELVPVLVHDDRTPEPDETFTLTLTNPTGATLGDATATGTIRDDGDTAARLTASAIEDTTATLTIGGHTDAWWYRGDAHACTAVAAGTTAVSINGLTTISSYDYAAYSDSGCQTKLARVEFTTIAPEGTPTVSVSDAAASEDSGISFEVSLSHPSREPVTVWYETSGGTATSGTDFTATSYNLKLPANSWNRGYAVGVHLLDDQEPEPDETFTLTLTKATGATLGDATATGTIRDDGDTAARLTVSDIEDTTATLTISGHADAWWYMGDAHGCTAVAAGTTSVSIGGLTAVSDYEYTAYSDSACSTKLANAEFDTIAPEGTPTVSISDAEVSEDGTWMDFRVSLSQPSREPVTVDVSTSGGTATSGTDYRAESGTLTFPANSMEPKRLSVLVRDDQEPEPDETFTVTLTNPVGATLGDATATGTIRDDGDTEATLTANDIEDTTAILSISGHTDGWWYRGRSKGTSSPWGGCTAVTAGTTAVSLSGLTALTTYEYGAFSDSACSTKLANVEFRTIAPAGTPTVSVSDAEVSEDGKWMRFAVSLSQASRKEVRVQYETSSGTAKGGTDFKEEMGLRAGWVIFGANSSDITHHARVKVYDDQEPEPDETFTLTLTKAWNATLGDATATGTIRDDGDTAATLAASDIEDTTATLTIAGHTDGWWYRGRSKGTSSPWGGCTAVTAGTTAVSLSGLTALMTYEYGAFSDSACSTKLARIEFRTIAPAGMPTVSVSDARVSEDDVFKRIRFAVSLSQPSREPVTVWFETSSGTATSGTDFDARPGHVSFSANSLQTTHYASVLVHDDEETEPDETFTLTLTRASNATLGDATTATGTIGDDGDTAATLAAGDIEDTTATLTIAGHTGGWWYKGNAHSCTAVTAGTTAVGISGLTAVTNYEYSAYSDSACSTRLASEAFRTLAAEGVTPTVSVSDAEVSEDGTWMQFWVSLSQPSREEVTVDVQTSGGTATSGTDFKAVSQTLTFSANSREPELVPVLVHDDRTPEPDETFTLTLTNPTGATLGDATATGTIRDDGDTGVTGVAVVSDPGGDATYAAGDTVNVQLTFAEAVAVDTANGTPRLKLDLGGNAGERWAAYEDGSGTTTLTFAWQAAALDESAAGVAVLADTLELDGGTIKSAATQADAALGHAGLAHDPAHKVDAAPPQLVRGEVDGGTMTLFFSEALDPGATGGRFMVDLARETPTAGFLTAGPVSVAGAAVTVELGEDNPRAQSGLLDGNHVLYARRADGGGGALRDVAGNPVVAPDVLPYGEVETWRGREEWRFVKIALENVTVARPAVTGVALASKPGDDGAYAAGDTVRVAVTFAEAVDVDTEGGTPRLKLDLDAEEGTGERWAAYEGGSGTNALTFAWRAAAPDEAAVGVAVPANTLELNGGTIRSTATQTAAALGHAGLAHDPAHKVDAMAPRLLRGEIDGGTMTLYFSEALDPDSTGGKFDMAVEVPETGVVGFRAIGEVAVEGATVTVGMGERYPRATAGLERNFVRYSRRADGADGALRDLAGNPVQTPHRTLLYTSDGTVELRYVKIDLVNVTGTGSSVTGVAVVSDAGDDDTYALGETIRVRVAFSEAVDVTGSPRLKIKMDPRWGEFWAAYERGGGTSSLTFAYQVARPNTAPSGIAVLANTLEFNGGTIRSGGTDANLAHTGLAHDASHKVDWRTQPGSGGGEDPAGLGGDDGPPAVTGVSLVSSPASGDTYMLGETIRIRATFSEVVSVTGGPTLEIDMDPAHWGTKQAAYASGGGTSSLDFVHTVVEPNYSTQGIAVLANSLALNGGAIRSADGTNAALGHTGRGHHSGHKVDWRPSISVADARANEGAGAKVAFEVSLSRAFTGTSHRVTVDYATADGTAKAGEDYTATSGTLTFAAGERRKTVNVPVLDDAVDEGEETFVLRLSNVHGARAGDLEATGTIANDDPLQKMWLSRFGRTVAIQTIEALEGRFALASQASPRMTMTVAGQDLDLSGVGEGKALAETLTGLARAFGAPDAANDDDPFARRGFGGAEAGASAATRRVTGRELLLGSSFHFTTGEASGLGGAMTGWGKVLSGGSDGSSSGGLSFASETATGVLGMDWERDRLLVGVALSQSLETGSASFAPTGSRYDIEGSLSMVTPYMQVRSGERLSFWGAVGSGSGSMSLSRGAGWQTADIAMRLAAAGARAELLRPGGGLALALKTDAFFVRTESERVSTPGLGNLAAATGDASRVRAVLEGSSRFALAGGGALEPSLELGLRHDGGDAETGTGVEFGGGVSWTDPGSGLTVEAKARMLAAHADRDYEEWGVSGAVRLSPGERGRGLSFSLAPTLGAAPSGSERLWGARDARSLAPGTGSGAGAGGGFEAARGLRGELGYGVALSGNRFTGTPNLGFGLSDSTRDYRIGWRLTPAAPGGPGFEVNLDATRREAANGNEPPEHGLMLRGAIRW